ncbi:MAG: hypothetical protein AAFV43_05160 [Planctomycetota bacterium]
MRTLERVVGVSLGILLLLLGAWLVLRYGSTSRGVATLPNGQPLNIVADGFGFNVDEVGAGTRIGVGGRVVEFTSNDRIKVDGRDVGSSRDLNPDAVLVFNGAELKLLSGGTALPMNLGQEFVDTRVDGE